ncbi:multi-sensor hybrid histidine kinase [Desulfurivibrio alkaliphilus AHT 2]|uniref:Multi-sensor hybrid histidine kinase n=2 Tax=Desulfurivibrio alkaliphilus TaxID=427923 RepID=D6Z2G4_DESAT|nr:multi-sensor hybrid histidine kinase [Desulfurivibrio alkaliphilus AHT 2]
MLQNFQRCLSLDELQEFFHQHRQMMQQTEQQITQALADNDLPTLGKAIHKIVGSAATPCFPMVHRLAHSLAEAARGNRLELARALATELLAARTEAWQLLTSRYPQLNKPAAAQPTSSQPAQP